MKVACECKACGLVFYDHPSHADRRKYCSRLCKESSVAVTRPFGDSPQGRLSLDNKGYVRVSVRGSRRGKYLHLLLAEQAVGRCLEGHVVHHADGNPQNNSKDNLVVLENNAEHRAIHARARVQANGGDPFSDKICASCGIVKPRTEFHDARCADCGRERCRRRYHARKDRS